MGTRSPMYTRLYRKYHVYGVLRNYIENGIYVVLHDIQYAYKYKNTVLYTPLMLRGSKHINTTRCWCPLGLDTIWLKSHLGESVLFAGLDYGPCP